MEKLTQRDTMCTVVLWLSVYKQLRVVVAVADVGYLLISMSILLKVELGSKVHHWAHHRSCALQQYPTSMHSVPPCPAQT